MLSVRNLTVSYGKIRALNDVSLEVAKGSIVTLIGANGAGKSTFLKAVSGLERVGAGDIFIEGTNITNKPGSWIARQGLAHVPEGRRIFPLLEVDENLAMGAFFRKDKEAVKKDRAWVFELFPVLFDRRKQLGGTLSGGEQQMLAMARGLMSRPRLLMLDEPSMGLSPVMVERVFSVIREINKTGVTIFLVEQNARAALSVAEQGYVLETGRLVLAGPCTGLLKNEKVRQCYLGIEEQLITQL